jgi:hypothetical protein
VKPLWISPALVLATVLAAAEPADACCGPYTATLVSVWHKGDAVLTETHIDDDYIVSLEWTLQVAGASRRFVGTASARSDELPPVESPVALPKHLARDEARLVAVEKRIKKLGGVNELGVEGARKRMDRALRELGWTRLRRETALDKCGLRARKKGRTLRLHIRDDDTDSWLPVAAFTEYRDSLFAQGTDVQACWLRDKGGRPVIELRYWDSDRPGCSVSAQRGMVIDAQKIAAMQANTRGFRAYQDKRYADALTEFKRSIDADPDYAHGNFNLACTLAFTGASLEDGKPYLERLLRQAEIRRAYVRKIERDPDLATWRDTDAFRAWWPKAKRRATRALSDDELDKLSRPARARELIRRGMRAYRRGKLDEARSAFDRATSEDPGSYQAKVNLASIYSLQKHFDWAHNLLLEVAETQPRYVLRKLEDDPDFEDLRFEPGYDELVAKAKAALATGAKR